MPFKLEDYQNYEFFSVSEIEQGFIHVQYTNPKTLNAFSEQNWKDYGEILTRLDQDEDTILILITSGVPRSFSSGLNIKSAAGLFPKGLTTSELEQYLKKHIKDFQDCVSVPARISTPTIGILNGINYGLALDLSTAFSIRIAVEDVKFSIAEVNIGIAADIGTLQRIPALVSNKSLLYQHALLGDVFGAEEALKMGFVSTVVPTIEDGIALAKRYGEKICSVPRWAIRGTKQHIQDMINGNTMEQGLVDIANYNAYHIARSNFLGKSKM